MRLNHIEHHIEQQLNLSSIISNSYDNLIKYGIENVTSQRINLRLSNLKENWDKFLVHDAITLAIRELDENDKIVIRNNPTLSPVEKLQYLKTSLTGTAGHMLSNTALTADNFSKAWESLILFYENKRLLVNAALSSLFNLKRMTRESSADLEKLYTTVTQIYRTLETLGRPVNSWDDFLIFIMIQRMDSESVKAWEQHIGSSRELPTWKQFMEFLITRVVTLQNYEKARAGKPLQPNQSTIKAHFQGKFKDESSSSCPFCSESHWPYHCPQYKSKTLPQRVALVKRHRLCYNCFGPHRAANCRMTVHCKKCAGKHHVSLHRGNFDTSNFKVSLSKSQKTEKVDESSEVGSDVNSKIKESQVLHATSREIISSPGVLLATALVLVESRSGQSSKAKVLIDQGSEVSLITERLAQRLQLSRTKSQIFLIGIGGKKSNKTKGLTSFQLKPHFTSTLEFPVTAHILPKLTAAVPSFSVKGFSWPHLNGLQLADPEYFVPSTIDIILGADVYCQILQEGVIKGPPGSPIAQSTGLGWIISGPVCPMTSSLKVHSFHISVEDDLYELIHRFWELDEVVPAKASILSSEELACEEHFVSTHSRNKDGRCIVRLPFCKPVEQLGDSKKKATRMMLKLSNKLSVNSEYLKLYSDFLDEYETLKHMRIVSNDLPEPNHAFYLPHHGVLKEQSLTTKLRVVFNGSSVTTSGFSLNDLLHTGAKLQTELFDVLIWFRRFRYVFSSDIEKMYRQIEVHKDDWNFQRILWFDRSLQLCTYQLTTVTYGLACAPFLALRTIQQLIDDEGPHFPLATPCLRKGRYVDDLFGGSDTIEETQSIINQVKMLCMAGGFKLQKWCANNPNVLLSVPKEEQVSSLAIDINDGAFVHILGLRWQPTTDTFQFTFDYQFDGEITKRKALSTIAKLFDPLGFLSPILINAKIFIQELWAIKVGWDDPLPPHIANQWHNFVDELQEIPRITFPRWIGLTGECQVDLHGFSDASQKAMAAVVYLPEWRFVSGQDNPADVATRGLTPSQLLNCPSWWNGPHWLSQASTSWPHGPIPSSQEGNLEERPAQTHSILASPDKEWDLLLRYSNLMKLFRITAICQRAVSKFRKIPLMTFSPSLTTEELNTAKIFWVKVTQQLFFPTEIKVLSKGQQIPRSSPLIRLTPFLDSSGLLRVGGRLQNSLLNEAEKHPLILPNKSALTSLIISDAHVRALHGGTQVTLSIIRKDYWLIGGRTPVRSWILKCVPCARFRQKRAQQLMGQLPLERITPSRPFAHTGVDYAGPFTTKTWKGKNARTYKSYIALFVCFATSAVHLELVTDYSAEAFIAAYKRFVSRRGICTTLTSDCGTTLKGADAELQRLFSTTTQESTKLARLLANHGTQWKFNPPSAPHFGGKWEAGVKSMKHHLLRIVGNTLLTYEEMSTLLAQVEAILNSRPLSPLSNDPDDLLALTSGHFLISYAPVTIPEPSLELVKTTHLLRWQLIRKMLESFWSRWSQECLQRYYSMSKWNNQVPSLNIGTLVLIIDERYPPSK
ncbi:PREDICTED: uncharacterized protein LOC108769020 [Trachymyrmex cornetzi]|uniref:uncharacterized protein LOC108769020 n=1 Tax=Trachymyrmex cornetzi TaxID=471704 RepID=UPI00084F09B9|nr:PREDICTED: uncharacterized protein LOC108769020 [Trachymyrmex cornetzi]